MSYQNINKSFYFLFLKEVSTRLLENHYDSVNHESTDNVVEMENLQDQQKNLCKTDAEFNLILAHLEKNKKIVRMKISENDVVCSVCL